MHEKIRANIGDLPKGIPEPLIVGRGINDVAIVTLTLSAAPGEADRWTDNGLYQVADELQHELAKVDNVGTAYIVGGSPNQIRVEPDPERLSVFGVTLNQLVDKISNANRSFQVGAFRDGGKRSRCSPARRSRASRTSGSCCSRRATDGRSMSRTWPTSSSAPPSPSIAPGR